MNIKMMPLGIALVSLMACARSDQAASSDSATAPAADTASTTPASSSPSGIAAEQMESHLKGLQTVSGDSLKSALPAHRQMTANLLATFNKEMRDMNMAADAAWSATVDSLRADLRSMPDLTAAQLKAQMPAHAGRVSRLMTMHRTMMKNMKM